MTPYDYASNVIKLEMDSKGELVAVLELGEVVSVALEKGPQAHLVASWARRAIAVAISKALAAECGEVAAHLNAATLDGWGMSAAEFTDYLRRRAELHAKSCMR